MNFPIPFTKMSGTGNDFILIDHRLPLLAGVDLANFARTICRRNFSVGADGLILIESSQSADFAWRFFNGDGSIAEMCGNGARCAARFAYVKNIAPRNMRFETIAGTIEAEVTNEQVKIRLTPPTAVNQQKDISVLGSVKTIHSINTGVPHAVLFVDDIKTIPVFEWGRIIRYDAGFQPAGTNVNFVELGAGRELLVRTYERGVENETMACGTGAVAAAIIAALHGKAASPVRVKTSGGERLIIHFTLNKERAGVMDVFLEGPANFIYEGQLNAEALRETCNSQQ